MLKTTHDGKSVVFHLSRPGDALYARAAGLAKTVYKASYDATIDPAPTTFLVCDEGVRTDIVACAGLSFGGDRRLFSEQYLDVDLELALDGVFGYPVKRDKAVEVTSLATITPNAGSELVKIIPILCWYWGMKAILCTATTRLQALLRHHKLPFAALAAADPGKLGRPRRATGEATTTATRRPESSASTASASCSSCIAGNTRRSTSRTSRTPRAAGRRAKPAWPPSRSAR